MLNNASRFDQIYIVTGFTDLRQKIDGLTAMIQQEFQLDPFQNVLFLFCDKRTDCIKALLYNYLHQELLKCNVCQTDEPSVEVKDGRTAESKSYMWVYRTGKMYNEHPLVLYDYQKTRNATYPKNLFTRLQRGIGK